MKEKPYMVTLGIPGRDRCKIVRRVDVDTYVRYWGRYDPNRDVWSLDSFTGTPPRYACKGMLVRPADVSYKTEPQAVPEKKEEPERKRWRYPGDPDGQVGLLGEGVGK